MILVANINQFFARCKNTVKLRPDLFKSVAALAGGNLMGSLLGALGGIIVARFVSPEVNGQFRVFTIPLMYLAFLHCGTFDGLYRQIPFYMGQNRPDRVEAIASTAGAWNRAVTFIVGGVFLLCAFWGGLHQDWHSAAGWFSQAAACVGVYYGLYLGSTYRTLNNFVLLSKIQFVQAVVAFALISTVVLWGFYGLCLRSALPVVLAVWLYHRTRPLRMPLRFNLAVFKEIIKLGVPLSFWGSMYTSFWTAAEYSLMLHFGGVKGVGLMAVAFVLRESLMTLPQAVHQVCMPRVVESYARSGGVSSAARKTVFVSLILAVVFLVFMYLIAALLDYFVPLFIPKYVDGLLLMKICLLFPVVQMAGIPLNGLVATGRSWLFGKGVLVGLIVFPAVIYFFVPITGGVVAVLLGSLAGRLVRTGVAYYDLFILVRKE